MNTKTKILSLAVTMFAIVGMMGFGNQAFAGNGAGGVGSGGYQLNLIGMDKTDKLTNDETNNGHRIFVPIDGHTKILLYEGPFAVLDSDATDGMGKFRLPYPGDCSDLSGACTFLYEVWIRVLGKPSATDYNIVTCRVLAGVEECSTETVAVPSANLGKGGAKFTNVSKQLLTVCIDTDDLDTLCNFRTEIFDDAAYQYLWDVDANGHRLAQLRFIPN